MGFPPPKGQNPKRVDSLVCRAAPLQGRKGQRLRLGQSKREYQAYKWLVHQLVQLIPCGQVKGMTTQSVSILPSPSCKEAILSCSEATEHGIKQPKRGPPSLKKAPIQRAQRGEELRLQRLHLHHCGAERWVAAALARVALLPGRQYFGGFVAIDRVCGKGNSLWALDG